MTVLVTDALIFLLIGAICAYAYQVRRLPHLREPWKQIRRSRLGMCSLVVLSFFITVGVLDSIHYHPKIDDPDNPGKKIESTRIESVFDQLVSPIKNNTEKTYSSPLSAYSYLKETVQTESGQERVSPRLKFGGAHLDDPKAERIPDIFKQIFVGSLIGLLISAIIIGLISARLIKLGLTFTQIKTGNTDTPWRTIFTTFTVMMVIISACANLANDYHLLGTDKVGQDVLYQSLKSIRTGLAIGTLTTLIMLPFALLLGTMAGYFGGWIDDIIQYIYTTLNSIPSILLIAAWVLILNVYMYNNPEQFSSTEHRADMRLLFICMILGLMSWTGLCRMLRAETLKVREMDYIGAARAFGLGPLTIIQRHIFPNVMHLVLISIVLDFSGLVLLEAVLSYVNLGLDPAMHSWGKMINAARLEMAREPAVWWSLAASLFFMFSLVLFANLFADTVRDAFDPRLRAHRG